MHYCNVFSVGHLCLYDRKVFWIHMELKSQLVFLPGEIKSLLFSVFSG